MTSAGLKKREDVKHISTAMKKRKDLKHTRLSGLQVGSIKDILTLTVWDAKVRAEFQKLKSNDRTEDKCVEASNTWDLENATKEAHKQNKC